MEPEKLRELATRQLEIARTWILCVGLIIFIVDQLFINVWHGDALGDVARVAIAGGELVVVIALVVLYRLRNPLAMFVVAGAGYGAVQIYLVDTGAPTYGLATLLRYAYVVGLCLGGGRVLLARRWLRGLAAVAPRSDAQ